MKKMLGYSLLTTIITLLSSCEIVVDDIFSYHHELTADSLRGTWDVIDEASEYLTIYDGRYEVYLTDDDNSENGLEIRNFANENITLTAELDDTLIIIPNQTFELDFVGAYWYEIQGHGSVDSSRTRFDIEYYLIEHWVGDSDGSHTAYNCTLRGERQNWR